MTLILNFFLSFENKTGLVLNAFDFYLAKDKVVVEFEVAALAIEYYIGTIFLSEVQAETLLVVKIYSVLQNGSIFVTLLPNCPSNRNLITVKYFMHHRVSDNQS